MNPLERLTYELSKLPSVGGKTALRLALYILRQPPEYARALSQALTDVVEKIRFCARCHHLSESEFCTICNDARREKQTLCVVEQSQDLMAIERTGSFRGVYHVLQGVLSPLDGIGPDKLTMNELFNRLRQEPVREVILATNHTVTGDATALYLAQKIRPSGIALTRLAAGIPVGSDIEYLDSLTLNRAFSSRQSFAG